MNDPSACYTRGLVRELRRLPRETEWFEFERTESSPEQIGEYISALANSAALLGKASAYLLWGIEDSSHELVGTAFDPALCRVGNEELESWLRRLLSPKLAFRFHEAEIEGRRIVVLEVERAFGHPVRFQGQEFVRVGSYKKKLRDFPEKERELWRAFDDTPFEDRFAVRHLDAQAVLQRLDHGAYFDLLQLPRPDQIDPVILALEAEGLLRRDDAGRFAITNLGAVLLARELGDYPGLWRKAVRLIRYDGVRRTAPAEERVFSRGFASGFQALVERIEAVLPHTEEISHAIRRNAPVYPSIAVRELVANALIHQDFFVTGQGSTVEIFTDRVEITNPGAPLVAADRFLDAPPRSRNEKLASLMRRFGICEERGSGIDKVVFHVESCQLPAPLFEVVGDATRITLLSPRPLNAMERSDRVRACYLHACLRYVDRAHLTNESLRARFGIEQRNAAIASRIFREAVEDGVIVPFQLGTAPKLRKYLPAWAMSSGSPGT